MATDAQARSGPLSRQGSGTVRLIVAASASLHAEAFALALCSTSDVTAIRKETADAGRAAKVGAADVIVALSQPRIDGEPAWASVARLASCVAELRAPVPIVAVAPSDAPESILMALESGARGYVSQTQPVADIHDAVATVISGGTYLSSRNAINIARLDETGASRLSGRELEVLRLIALGATNRDAAEHLHLSERTIETHRANLRSKRGLADQSAIVAEAIELGLIA